MSREEGGKEESGQEEGRLGKGKKRVGGRVDRHRGGGGGVRDGIEREHEGITGKDTKGRDAEGTRRLDRVRKGMER